MNISNGVYLFDPNTKQPLGYFPFNPEGNLRKDANLDDRPVGTVAVKIQNRGGGVEHIAVFDKVSNAETTTDSWKHGSRVGSSLQEEFIPDYVRAYFLLLGLK